MVMKAKYIILKQGTFEVPFVFSELNQHADVAFALGGERSVVGAGFCFVDEDRYHCYGESISCKVKSRGEVDAKILNRLLGVDYD
jgi:hypothetical protein